MHKIVVAITGASGSVYAKVLLEKLEQVWQQGHSLELSLVMTENARLVWETELGTRSFENLHARNYRNTRLYGPLCFRLGSVWNHDHYSLQHGHAGKNSPGHL